MRKGRIEVLGAILEADQSFSVRLGRRMPAFARDEDAHLELFGRIRYHLIEGDPIPVQWRKAPDLFLMKASPTVMIVGPVDSGKSSLCTFLANMALNLSNRVALVDGDPGQGDIGPPSCIAFGMASKQFTDLRSIKPTYVGFLGVTSPSLDIQGDIDEIQRAVDLAHSSGSDYTFVNTDGWMDSDGIEHKRSVANRIKPDTIIYIGTYERPQVDERLFGQGAFVVEPLSNVLRRNTGTRARARLTNFIRYFRNSRLIVVPRNKIINMDSILPEEGSIFGFFRFDKFIGLGILEGWDESDSLRIYTSINSFDYAKAGKSTVPTLLDLLKKRTGRG